MKLTLALSSFLLPTVAYAHAGTGEGFLRGLQHPLGGIDHVLAMLAVGIWAAQRGGRAFWLVPATFVVTMAVGGLIGAMGIAVPFTEACIVLSVLVLGLLVAGAARLSPAASAAIVGLLAVFHGLAHGSEIPADASGWAYGAGFLVATASLLGLGIAVALLMRRIERIVAWS